MLDLIAPQIGKDLLLADSAVRKGANVLEVQLRDLEYAPTFGVDLKYFLETEFEIQPESFRSYLVQRLTQSFINVSEVRTQLDTLLVRYGFYVDDSNQNNGGLIA